MPAEPGPDLKMEIGHVLFIDIVGYSKLLITEQSELLNKLKEIVRGTEQFRIAEAEGKLLRLPTGDGGALVFRNSPEAPVLCAMEIAKALKDHPQLRVRMGIHSGPVNEISDLNEQANIAGAGINIAQRVMDCGDAGHILLSKRVADDLEQYPQWQSHLHDLGECEVKHGSLLSVVNLYTDEVGNPQMPEKLKAKGQTGTRTISMLGFGAHPIKRVIIATIVVAILAIGLFLFLHRSRPSEAKVASNGPGVSTNDKSIAVLPFENLSGNPENAYFTDGIQEEILMRLAKIADLKVVSRTSTVRYKSSPDNLREIAMQLGVANVLEGSVQRTADQVRVNVQLIKAASDAHLWAEAYDRKLTDIFAVESEIAKTVADTLQAKLTGTEERAMLAKPTADFEAHQLYLKGRYLWNRRTGENLKKALAYFEQAAEKDPHYALAYAGIADSCSLISAYAAGAPQEYLPRARAAAQKAVQLDDTLAEAHTSLAYLFFLDFKRAQSVKEFERAISLNPNYAPAHQWYGRLLLPMVGEFDRAIAEEKRALELDPVSPTISTDLGTVYALARRYDEAIAQLRDTVEMNPQFQRGHWELGWALELKGATGEAIAEYRKAFELSENPVLLALLAHAEVSIGNQNEARQILAQLTEDAKSRYVPAYAFAVVHLTLGERDQALDWLEKAAHEHAGNNIYLIKVDPYLDPLRGDPRFETLVSAILSGSVK